MVQQIVSVFSAKQAKNGRYDELESGLDIPIIHVQLNTARKDPKEGVGETKRRLTLLQK